MASLEAILKVREGYKEVVYLDSLKRPTVGIGHLITSRDKLKVGDKISSERISRFFREDSAKAVAAARKQAAEAGIDDPDFIVALACVNFQLGTEWHRKFSKTWALIVQGDYAAAMKEVAHSRWMQQTPVRVRDFQDALFRLPNKKALSMKLA